MHAVLVQYPAHQKVLYKLPGEQEMGILENSISRIEKPDESLFPDRLYRHIFFAANHKQVNNSGKKLLMLSTKPGYCH